MFMQAHGYVTIEELEKRLSWSSGRAIDALETLLKVSPSYLQINANISICLMISRGGYFRKALP